MLLIPKHISRVAFFVAPVAIFSSSVAYYCGHTLTAGLLFGILCTSYFHWKEVKTVGIEKTVDIIVSVSSLSYITFYESHTFGLYRAVWLYSIGISVFAFIVNESVFYYRIQYDNSDNVYYCSVYTHMIFIHALPTLTIAYCVTQ